MLQKNVTLAPGEEARLLFLLGEGDLEAGKAAKTRWTPEKADEDFSRLAEFWDKKLSCLQVSTPNEGMNTELNIWNLYQSEINVMFSRFTSFIEVGGRVGLGYRDTAQDAMMVPHANPEKCRSRLVELLRALTKEGYGLHLFEPRWFEKGAPQQSFKSPTVIPTPDKSQIVHGLKDACADDALWLVPAVVQYVKETGELSFLDEPVTYADGGEETVYRHLMRILDFSARQVGTHGICKGLRADWNDCLNLGGGESAMVKFFAIFGHWTILCSWPIALGVRSMRRAMKNSANPSRKPVKASSGTENGISAASPPTAEKSARSRIPRAASIWRATLGRFCPVRPAGNEGFPPWMR